MSDIEIGSEWVQKKKTPKEFEVVVLSGDSLMVKENGEGFSIPWYTSDFLEHHEPKVKADMVNHPPHYKDASGVGCTEVVKHMMYFGGACFKYLYRCGNKWDDVEDLKKAVRCAELADEDRFITDESWLRAMYQVASHRDGNIQQAMFNIRSQQWEYVIEYIKAEIARLESEIADD